MLTGCISCDFCKCVFDSRNTQDNDGDRHLSKDVAVIVDNRINTVEVMCVEPFRHVIHPVNVSADGMEQTSCQTCHNISDEQTVFLPKPESCDAECGKSKEVITANLKRTEEIAAAGLDKLQDAVGKRSEKSDRYSIQISDITDKEHTE